MTVLPSVSSLRALRRFAKVARARRPFMGFGDPVLEGMPGDRRGIEIASVFRGALADVDTVRRLPPLPETADELRAIAKVLNAGDGAVFLGNQATEWTVRNTDLSDSRVLAFATHGLVAGQISGAAEPALVLTPPAGQAHHAHAGRGRRTSGHRPRRGAQALDAGADGGSRKPAFRPPTVLGSVRGRRRGRRSEAIGTMNPGCPGNRLQDSHSASVVSGV
jgi:hypothetical protein